MGSDFAWMEMACSKCEERGMTDFIKVNFLADRTIGGEIIKHARAYILPKLNMRMTAYANVFYAWDITDDERRGDVSKEEYDRLCKELGIENAV